MRIFFFILIFCIAWTGAAVARAEDTHTIEPDSITFAPDSTQVGELRLNVYSTLFFRDNEFSNPMIRGYTLPGFRLNPTVSYAPNEKINVELGVYMLRFWGTDSYPNLAYSDIAYWSGDDKKTKGLHTLPFFRVTYTNGSSLGIVLGNLYGGYHHRLIQPLYARELNLTADPEAGAQILYSNKWLDADVWINWESFIYKGDTHQEAFTFGVSSRLKYNSISSRLHVYSPVQALFQHRGGEIDNITTNSVQTNMNAAAGLGVRYNINHRALHSASVEADALVYNQQKGSLYPFDKGWALFVHGDVDVANVKCRLGYYRSHKFLSLFGYPFYGDVSVSEPGLTFDNRQMLTAGFRYMWNVAPGYSLGFNAEIYRHLGAEGTIGGSTTHYPASTGFAGALFLRLSPSFLLKKIKG